ncbi:hypothetical protein CPC08DRAFT_127023 [Agrocybe pediades]|nr:hypothetical protein CPC08DRAFT_127023 [Agrocybe pediades]
MSWDGNAQGTRFLDVAGLSIKILSASIVPTVSMSTLHMGRNFIGLARHERYPHGTRGWVLSIVYCFTARRFFLGTYIGKYTSSCFHLRLYSSLFPTHLLSLRSWFVTCRTPMMQRLSWHQNQQQLCLT